MSTMYDPPAGWRYGFPKPYRPLPGEEIAETLLRDGYPQFELDMDGAKRVRFWNAGETADDRESV